MRLAVAWKKWLIGGLAVLVLLGAGFALWSAPGLPLSPQPPSSEVHSAEDAARSVEVARVDQQELQRTVEAIGTLEAYERVTLRAKVAGRIERIEVDLGDEVEMGQKVAQIERRDYELEVDRAQAQLDQALARLGITNDEEATLSIQEVSVVEQRRATLNEAQRQLQRLQQLSEGGIVSRSDLDSAEVAVEVASSELEEALQEARHRLATLKERRAARAIAQQELTETELRAPFTGAVTRRSVDTGEYLEVGDPVVTLVRMDVVRLRLEVPERLSGRIAHGQVIHFRLEESAAPHEARVERISPVIEPGNRMLLIEANVVNGGDLRPGSFVRAQIVVDPADPALTVPRSAVSTFAGVHKVFVVREGHAEELPVTVGDQGDNWAEISGLSAGDLVVLNPGNLRSGSAVQIANEGVLAHASPGT